jgi:putative exporter of polyketide antibiotics
MINRGLIRKALHELLPIMALFGTLALLFEAALAFVLPKLAVQLSDQLLQMPFLQNIMRAILGVDVADGVGPGFIMSMCWAHPGVLAITWAHTIITCTRVPAGEVDRGTIDVLLGLPVSRWQLYLTETVIWLAGGVVLIALALCGNTVGGLLAPPETRPEMGRIFIVLVNLLCMYAAIGAFALLMSALSDRRGRAITVVFVVVLVSFLLSFLAQFWAPAEKVAVLSVLQYYRPVFILRDGTWPMVDIAVLLGVSGALWTAAGIVFARRDLCTV